MKTETLNRLIKNEKLLEKFILKYKKDKFLFKDKTDFNEMKGHLEKAEHNLRFITDTFKSKYLDWCITGCYYAVYHASLSLLNLKDWRSKHHNATLCILIKEYLNKEIGETEIKLINTFFLTYNDLLFYVESKSKRNLATYSTNIVFDENSVRKMIAISREYINKVRNIIKSTGENF
jgi:uncharacterized protein (UPF0332 family)